VFSLQQHLQHQISESPHALRRVFHGRGKAYPGLEHLNIEWYPPYLLVQNFDPSLSESVLEALTKVFEEQHDIAAVLVQSRQWPDFSAEVILNRSEVALPLTQWSALSSTLACETVLGKNRNTGVFLDMRAGWHWVRENANQKRVLNLFSYTGVFSLFALDGGALKVDNVDMAANVLKIAQRNHQHNALHDGKCAFYKRDILKSDRWLESRDPYDLIILDPPPYQKKAFRGWADYSKLLLNCRQALSSGGQLFACLNNPQVSVEEFCDALSLLFGDALKGLAVVERASEIQELDPTKGLKTVVVQF